MIRTKIGKVVERKNEFRARRTLRLTSTNRQPNNQRMKPRSQPQTRLNCSWGSDWIRSKRANKQKTVLLLREQKKIIQVPGDLFPTFHAEDSRILETNEKESCWNREVFHLIEIFV